MRILGTRLVISAEYDTIYPYGILPVIDRKTAQFLWSPFPGAMIRIAWNREILEPPLLRISRIIAELEPHAIIHSPLIRNRKLFFALVFHYPDHRLRQPFGVTIPLDVFNEDNYVLTEALRGFLAKDDDNHG